MSQRAWPGGPPLAAIAAMEEARWAALSPEQRAAEVRAQADAAAASWAIRERMEAEAREVHTRAIAAAERLMEAGGLGLRARVGITHEEVRPNLLSRLLLDQRRYRRVELELEPAWPIGAYGWNTRKDIIEAVETGLTPTGRVVPMTGASLEEQGGTVAHWLTASSMSFPNARGDDTWRGPVASWTSIADEMERLVATLL